jgi:hypothetical protein
VERLASKHEGAAMNAALAKVSPAEQKAWRKVMIALAQMA